MEIENQFFNDFTSSSSLFFQNYSNHKYPTSNSDQEQTCGEDIQQNELQLQIFNSNNSQVYTPQNLEKKQQENEEVTKAIQKKRKGTISKKKKLKYKKLEVIKIFNKIISESLITLSHGLTITSDGVIRFSYTLGQVSFGFNCHQMQNINYKKLLNMIEIDLNIVEDVNQVTLDEALMFISKTPCKYYQEACTALKEYSKQRRYLQNVFDTIIVDKEIINKCDEELIKHIESCQEYIENYSKKHEGQIFQYVIGRLNFEKKDFEITKCGYSKSYLELIGVDVSSFNQILLRNEQIDLIQDKDEILKQSLTGLKIQMLKQEDFSISSNITTLDGFPIKIHQLKKFLVPDYQGKRLTSFPFEYIFALTEIDVDIQDLQNLIGYRERLIMNRNNLNFDDFIKKELSYIFEDVEYSVHSQFFVEKYYKESLQNLYLLERQKQKQRQTQNYSKQCNFKQIKNNQEINPIQIVYSQ